MVDTFGNNKTETSTETAHRARVEDFAATSGSWFWETDADLRFTYFSPNVFDITGVEPEWHYGKTREEIGIPSAISDEQWQAHLTTLRNREPFTDFVFQREATDGRKWLRTNGVPFFDAENTFLGYRGTGADITAEVTARLAVKQIADAIEHLDELFALWDADDRLVICNDRFRQINRKVIETTRPGTLFEDHLNAALEAGLYPSAKGREHEWVEDRLHRHRNPGAPIEMQRQSGQWLLIREQRLFDGSTVTYSSEITERKQTELELAAFLERERDALQKMSVSEAQQSSTLASMAEGIVMQDADGQIVLSNPAAENILGMTADQMAGRTSADPKWGAIREDGAQFPGDQHPAMVTLQTGQPQRGVIMGIQKPDGSETWISINSEPVFANGSGAPTAVVATFHDITEDRKKEAQLRLQTGQLQKFAYLASHDLREPLRKISLFVDLLEESLTDSGDDSQKEFIGSIRRSAQRGMSLVKDVLEFSSLTNKGIDRKWFNLKELVDGIADRYRTDEITFSTELKIGEVNADRSLVEICVSNILGNAIKYRDAVRLPHVEIASHFDEMSKSFDISFADNGTGFDPAYKAKIFEPFTRLVPKHSSEGSGIGMSFVKDIVTSHGWQIDCDGQPGEGAVFTIRIPGRDARQPG